MCGVSGTVGSAHSTELQTEGQAQDGTQAPPTPFLHQRCVTPELLMVGGSASVCCFKALPKLCAPWRPFAVVPVSVPSITLHIRLVLLLTRIGRPGPVDSCTVRSASVLP